MGGEPDPKKIEIMCNPLKRGKEKKDLSSNQNLSTSIN